MNWESVEKLRDAEFARLTGLKRTTFEAMLQVLKDFEQAHFGRPFKLSAEERLLLTNWYWTEYRSLHRLGVDFGISESAACRCVKCVEDLLIKSGKFRLDGKKPCFRKRTLPTRWL